MYVAIFAFDFITFNQTYLIVYVFKWLTICDLL